MLRMFAVSLEVIQAMSEIKVIPLRGKEFTIWTS